MSKAEEIIVDAFTRASVRIHWVFLANLILAALVMSSVYAREYSYDASLIKAAQIFILDAEEKMRAIEAKYPGTIPLKKPNGETFAAAPVREWTENDKADYGSLVFRQQRATNILKEVTMDSAETPILSTSIAPNDFDIFCGLLMSVFSLWIYVATSQINYILKHVKTNIAISNSRWAVRHILVTMYLTPPVLLVLLTALIVFLPTIAMAWSTAASMKSEEALMAASYKEIVKDAYYWLVDIKKAITAALFVLGICICVMWFAVVRHFREV
jgi:hypothetical protein